VTFTDRVLGSEAEREKLPDCDPLPWYVAPLPRWLEDVGLRWAWVVVAVNLLGTAFGFWYYGFHPLSEPVLVGQFALEPPATWLLVPDSPTATLFVAASLAAWKLGRSREWLNALAFFGCIKLGAWTPFVLLAFKSEFSYLHPAMYNFLFWSHLAMVAEAFLIHRYSDFPTRAVAVGAGWYLLNDVVDYFVPVVGRPHHTLVPSEPVVREGGRLVVEHVSPAHEIAAAGAVVLTVAATFLALATRVEKLQAGTVE
jgi:uncharacterized membrane protein YpjA